MPGVMFQFDPSGLCRSAYARISGLLTQSVVGFALCLVAIVWLAALHQIETERKALQRDTET